MTSRLFSRHWGIGLYALPLALLVIGWQSDWPGFGSKELSATLWIVGIVALTLLIITPIVFGYIYGHEWTGVVEVVKQPYSRISKTQSKKTVWDWMQLLLIPVGLAIATYLFNAAQNDNNRSYQERQAQETALQAYLDQMTTLLHTPSRTSASSASGGSTGGDIPQSSARGLLNSASSSSERILARSRTLEVLRRANDSERRRTVVQFLAEAGLISTKVGLENHRGLSNVEKPPIIGLNGAYLVSADLSRLPGSGLQDTSLSGALLSSADLSGTNLSDADLTDADLTGAKLASADTSHTLTTLTKATLVNADLTNADLAGVNFAGADLTSAHLTCADLKGVYFTSASLPCANLAGAIFTGANLANADLTGAEITGAVSLNGANLTSARLACADSTQAYLTRADFACANLSGANLNNTCLLGANLEGANLAGALLYDTDLTFATLTGADLREVKGLDPEELEKAAGDATTKLPENVDWPKSWTNGENE